MSKRLLPAVTFGVLSLACVKMLPPPADEPSPYKDIQLVESYQNGLSSAERRAYYHADEGIHYLPIDLLLSLSRPVVNEDGSFSMQMYDERILDKPERLGLYPDFLDPTAPPIGITVSTEPHYLPMAGVNCSTCHTALLVKDKRGILIDGASSIFAIDRLISEMVFSIVYTVLSPEEFNRMYARLQARRKLGATDPAQESAIEELMGSAEAKAFRGEAEKVDDAPHEMVEEAEALLAKIHARAEEKHDDTISIDPPEASSKLKATGAYPTPKQLDSVYEVYAYLARRILFFAGAAKYASGGTGSPGLGRSNPWSVTKNMIAANAAALGIGLPNKGSGEWLPNTNGSINTPNIWGFKQNQWIFWTGVTNSVVERNLAQGISLVTDYDWKSCETTVSVTLLHDIMTRYTQKAEPPAWPSELFGAPDAAKAERGKKVFESACYGCHSPRDVRPGPGGSSQHYHNASTDRAYYDGQAQSFYGKDFFADVLAPWLKRVKHSAYDREGVAAANREKLEEGRLPVTWRKPGVNEFTARTLWGIWATAPYLHNGSVASIRELLTPPAKRLQSFWVGSLAFDPAVLGFKNEKTHYGSKIDCTVRGNSPDGHEYGVSLPEEDKVALIEFLKVYGPDTKLTDPDPELTDPHAKAPAPAAPAAEVKP